MADLRRADQRTGIRERPTWQHVADNTAFVDIANLGVRFFVLCVIIGDNFDVIWLCYGCFHHDRRNTSLKFSWPPLKN